VGDTPGLTPCGIQSDTLSRRDAPRSKVSAAAQRLPLPEGTLPVGLGLLIAGLASYAFFIVGKGALGDEDFKPISSLWFATFVIAPGIFLPLEQEVGRALAHRRALHEGGRPVVRRVLVLGAVLAAIVTIVLLGLSPLLTSSLFEDNWWVTAALVIAFLAYAPAHLARGICSGSGRFRPYAVVMGSDGLVRIVACAALAAVGVKTVGAYAFVVALAPIVGVIAVASRGSLRTEPGPPADWQEVTPNLGWLLLGSMLSAALVNAGPLATDLLKDAGQEAQVTAFASAVLMARVPLFLFQAVQAALLPRLARLAASGDLDEFRLGFKRLLVVVCGVGLFGTVAALVAGPVVFDILFTDSGALELRRTLTLLALGSACYMVAMGTAQAVIALHGHALVAIGWSIGMVVFFGATAISGDDLFLRVEIGLLAGSAAAMISFLFALRARIRAGVPASEESFIQAIIDLPIEP
jgi:O-antigen/teichoic acid export membrane protein